MQIQFEGQTYELEPGETVLACLERHGVEVSSFCRGGSCQTCLLRATGGGVPPAAQAGLGAAWKEQGLFLSCICRPTENLELARADVAQAYPAEILRVERLSGSVTRLWLSRPRGFQYQGGQFVQVVRPSDGLMRPYSLASLRGSDELEMHVAVLPDGQLSPWLDAGAGRVVEIRGPLGECVHVRGDSRRPLLLAGTGTGLAPLLGVVRTALAARHVGPIRLYHGSRTLDGLYLRDELEALHASVENVHVTFSVLDAPGPTELASGASLSNQSLDELVLSHDGDLRQRFTYLCGDPRLVRGLQKKLDRAGALPANVFGDAFDAPGRD